MGTQVCTSLPSQTIKHFPLYKEKEKGKENKFSLSFKLEDVLVFPDPLFLLYI
jgi:hypothetical protein